MQEEAGALLTEERGWVSPSGRQHRKCLVLVLESSPAMLESGTGEGAAT